MARKKNTISLNGKEYYVRGPVIAQPVSDFAANVRVGEASYDTRQGAGYAIFDDWSGGPGIVNGLVREDLSRYAGNGGVDTRFARQATSPMATSVATDYPDAADSAQTDAELLLASQTNGMCQHLYDAGNGNTYDIFVYGHGINYQIPSAYSLDWTTQDSGLDNIRDACKYLPVTGSNVGKEWLICVGKSGWKVWLPSAGFGAISNLSTTAMHSCISYGDGLYIQVGASALGANNGDVVVSYDAATVVKDSGGSNADIIWHLPTGKFLGPAPAPWGSETIPYFFSETDLYALSLAARGAYRVPIGLANIKCATTWSEGLVLSDGYNIVHYLPGEPGNVRHIGLPKEQGFLGADQGASWVVECLQAVDGGYLYALLRRDAATDLLQLWEYRGATWHPIGFPSFIETASPLYGTGLLIADRSMGSGGNALPQRVYWFMGSDLVNNPDEKSRAWRISDPVGDPNPLIGTAAFSTTGTSIITPWLDGGFAELDGVALQLWNGGTATATETIAVSYGLNGSSSWTSLGTFNNSVTRLDFGTADGDSGAHPGLAFKTIRFKFELTATASATPNALPMTFVFRKKPELRMSYLFNIDAAQELESCAEDGTSKEFATIISELADAWNASTLIRFYYPVRTEDGSAVASANLEVDRRVDMVSMPTREIDVRDAVRRGVVTVQVMEPCAW